MAHPVAPMVVPEESIQMEEPTVDLPHPSIQISEPTLVVPKTMIRYVQMAQPTTVVVRQPGQVQRPGLPPATRDWSTGICGFCDDINICT